MTRKQKKTLARIIVSFIILAGEMIFFAVSDIDLGIWELICYLVPYLIIGYDILKKFFLGIIHLNLLDENFLMTIATIGAFATGEYSEGAAVMLFYQIGELFQSCAVNKSRKSIASLMDIRPDYANIEVENGELVRVSPDEVSCGDIIAVKPGEKIPLDGTIISGQTTLDTSALTGESLPRDADEGSEVMSGCINLTGVIRVRVTKEFENSTVSKILELVESSQEKKAKSENFITSFARIYTPAVVIGAILLAVIPPIASGGGWSEWIHRAMTFLVISCPCALVISIPLTFFSGIGGASKQGILIKGGNFIEALANTSIAVFDKTGTLTKGCFEVSEVLPNDCTSEELLNYAALAEIYSVHPIAAAMRKACGTLPDPDLVEKVTEIAGHGVKAQLKSGETIIAGSAKLMSDEGVSLSDVSYTGTIIHVSLSGKYMGYIVIADTIKSTSEAAVRQLKAEGIRKTVMLTGDSEGTAAMCAEQLKIDEYHSGLLPKDKVELIEQLMNQKQGRETLIFAGDGINDAPVLTRSDVGIAMGAIGSDAAIEAADVVLMDDDPVKIAQAVRISRKVISIVKQNIVFALGVKLIVLVLGALGIANMWAAVFADVGVSVIAILNATRGAVCRQAE